MFHKNNAQEIFGSREFKTIFWGARQKVLAHPWYKEQQNYAFYKDNDRLLLSRIQTLNNIP